MLTFSNRDTLWTYFRQFEPHLIRSRKQGRLRRRRFWAAGVNDIVTFDQHDKWKYQFGLCLHVGLDPFSGYVKWLRIWWNNSNPRLIFSYYIADVKATGGELSICEHIYLI